MMPTISQTELRVGVSYDSQSDTFSRRNRNCLRSSRDDGKASIYRNKEFYRENSPILVDQQADKGSACCYILNVILVSIP